jgi:hypothetical protein
MRWMTPGEAARELMLSDLLMSGSWPGRRFLTL